jgi:hypothetical protein
VESIFTAAVTILNVTKQTPFTERYLQTVEETTKLPWISWPSVSNIGI